MNRKFLVLTFLSTLFLLFSLKISAQSKQRVRFADGTSSTTMTGTVRGYAYRDYVISARPDQIVSVNLNSRNRFTVLTIFTPDGSNLEGSSQRSEFTGELLEDGDYVIRVGMMRAEARRKNSISNYSLRISVR